MSTRAEDAGMPAFTGGEAAGREGTAPRRPIATFAAYVEAQRAVDRLSDAGFPVERTAIVGEGLRLVEQITGRVGRRQSALAGALQGAVIGALFGWLFGLFDWVDPLVAGAALALYGLLIGALFGGLTGLLAHAFSGGRRDFGSVRGVEAERYVVLADEEVATEASRILADGAGAGTA